MDTLLVSITRINRVRIDPNENFIDEEHIQFYRQEIPMHLINDHKQNLMREIIAICNDLTVPKD